MKTPAQHKITKANEPPIDLPHDAGPRDDLFSRLMAKTGGAVDAEDLKAVLKPASEIPKPQPKVDNTCPTCEEELIDGECWTCG